MHSTRLTPLLLLGLVFLGPTPVDAQTPSQTLDPALLDSEPVEDIPEPAPPPAKTAPSPAAKPAAEEPVKEPNAAVLQGLNKVTAKIVTIEAPVDVTVPFGTLLITLKKCWRSAPDEKPENAALLEIIDRKSDQKNVTAFSGWMFSSSPAVSALEHPVYDVTMLECQTK